MSTIVVIFDTNVLIKVYLHRHVLADRSPYAEIYDAILDGRLVLIYSRATMNELIWKLSCPNELTQRFQIDANDARLFIESIFYELGDFAANVLGAQGLSDDPKDWMFEEAAIVGGVNLGRPAFLVSDDKDLHGAVVVANLRNYGITVLRSRDFGPHIPRTDSDA